MGACPPMEGDAGEYPEDGGALEGGMVGDGDWEGELGDGMAPGWPGVPG